MNYLASPPLVVAYALAGTMDIDLLDEPLGQDSDGNDVFLSDIWPSSEEVGRVVEEAVRSEMFQKSYGEVFEGGEEWNALEVPEGDRYAWSDESTYVRRPSFLEDIPREPEPRGDVEGARVLALLGDSVTTDHISPAGSIKKGSPAALYLNEHGVEQAEFNSYGARRGNHEVMMRGTFANIRLRNLLAGRDDLVGGLTLKLPEGEQMPIYDAAMRYAEEGTPLVVIAGKEYGSGSSRDWAAKGTNLLGVRAVIAESFERIHRSNLVGMGVLPLQFADGDSAESLGLTGEEELAISGIENGEAKEVTVRADEQGVHGARADRHPQGGPVLPARRHPAVRAASAARARLIRDQFPRRRRSKWVCDSARRSSRPARPPPGSRSRRTSSTRSARARSRRSGSRSAATRYRSTVASRSGRYLVGVSAENRAARRSRRRATRWTSTSSSTPNRARWPSRPTSRARSTAIPRRAAFFEGLSFSQQQWYVMPIEQAKKPETRTTARREGRRDAARRSQALNRSPGSR